MDFVSSPIRHPDIRFEQDYSSRKTSSSHSASWMTGGYYSFRDGTIGNRCRSECVGVDQPGGVTLSRQRFFCVMWSDLF